MRITKAKYEAGHLVLTVFPPSEGMRFAYQFSEGEYEISKAKKRRSLDANAYFWKLVTEIAEAVRLDKNEVYLEFVRHHGVYKDFSLTEDEAKTFRAAWERLGTGWPTEQVDYDTSGERVVIRAYYGSSQYNTAQMSRLINAAVDEAKNLGIETLPPEKLALLKEAWG